MVAALPAVASADPTIAKLRIESGERALSRGVSYVNDTARLATAPSQCNGSGARKTVGGPSAIGIVDYARQTNTLLRPYYVSDQFDFALVVCRIGSAGAFSADEAWLYRVNHVSPSVGGDQYRLRRGDEVLWYFANFATGKNTGDELELRAPGRVLAGRSFTVTALAYDAGGTPRRASGVRVTGGARAVVTGSDGTARVTPVRAGTPRLRGTRGNDIPTAPTEVCVNSDIDRCPTRPPEQIVGTMAADKIRGSATPDRIDARGGRDQIDVRGGGADFVRCGGGFDSVASRQIDRVASDCERVNGITRG